MVIQLLLIQLLLSHYGHVPKKENNSH